MNKKDFANFIKEKRKELNLTQEELAEKMNVSRNVVSKWENGVCYPDLETTQLLAKVIGVQPNEIFEKSSINDSKYSINPAFIIAPIVAMVALAGLIIVSLSTRDRNIIPVDITDDPTYEAASADAEKFQYVGGWLSSDITDAQLSYKIEKADEKDITKTSEKEAIIKALVGLDGGVLVDNYKTDRYNFEIYCVTRRPERAAGTFKINKRDNVIYIIPPEGEPAAYRFDEKQVQEIIDCIWECEVKREIERIEKIKEEAAEKAKTTQSSSAR